MMTRVIHLIALFSIFFSLHARTVDSNLTIKKAPTVTRIMEISFACGVIGGSLAALNESPYGPNFFVGLSALFGPLFATVASMVITTVLSGKMRLATLLLPGYIATPAFYISWLGTYYLMKNSNVDLNTSY